MPVRLPPDSPVMVLTSVSMKVTMTVMVETHSAAVVFRMTRKLIPLRTKSQDRPKALKNVRNRTSNLTYIMAARIPNPRWLRMRKPSALSIVTSRLTVTPWVARSLVALFSSGRRKRSRVSPLRPTRQVLRNNIMVMLSRNRGLPDPPPQTTPLRHTNVLVRRRRLLCQTKEATRRS